MSDLNMTPQEAIADASDDKMDSLVGENAPEFNMTSTPEFSMIRKIAEHKEGVFDSSEGT